MKICVCLAIVLGLFIIRIPFDGSAGALAALATDGHSAAQSTTSEQPSRMNQKAGESSVSYENGLLTVKARWVLPQVLFREIADKTGVEIEVDQCITDPITVDFSKVYLAEGLDKLFDQLGNGSYAVEYAKDGDSREADFRVDRVFILRRSASDVGSKGPVRKVVTGKKVLSKEEVLLIAKNRTLNEAILDVTMSNGDPKLVAGLKIGEPYLKWGIRPTDRHLVPAVWAIPMFNKDNRFVSERTIHADTGKNSSGSPPGNYLAFHYYTVPEDLKPVQTEAKAKYNIQVSGEDLAKAVRLSFWDANLYWLFPDPTNSVLVSQFRSAVDDIMELDLSNFLDALFLVPVDPFRAGAKELKVPDQPLITSLREKIEKKEDDYLRSVVSFLWKLEQKSLKKPLSREEQDAMESVKKHFLDVAGDATKQKKIDEIRKELEDGGGSR